MTIHKPAAMSAALADIDAGMTAYAAAKKHGLQQSSVSRALKRLANVCPTCGHAVKSPGSHLPMAQAIDAASNPATLATD